MTPLLDEAIAEVEQLSPDDQDEFARWMLAELANRREWEATLMAQVESLEAMAAGEALEARGN